MKGQLSSSAKNVAKTVSKIVRNDPDELTWEQLKAIEKRRRKILTQSDYPFYRILMFWDGTVLKILSRDPLMWLTIVIYVGVRIWARFGLPSVFSDIAGADIGAIGAFLSFFLVFFVVTSNRRFDYLYSMSMACKGRILDVAQLAKATLPRENALRLVRFMNAVVSKPFFNILFIRRCLCATRAMQ